MIVYNENHIKCFIISVILGTLYYFNMSLSIPKNLNCSFVANIWTDIFAFIGALIIVYKGVYKYNDCLLCIIGTLIITEHVWQVFFNKL